MDGDGFREWRARELNLRGGFVEVGGGALRVEAGFFCGELDLDEPFARRAGFFWPCDDLVDEKDVVLVGVGVVGLRGERKDLFVRVRLGEVGHGWFLEGIARGAACERPRDDLRGWRWIVSAMCA